MTDPYALAGVLEQLARVHVLVVGDVMLDRFVSGTVERISPEAPIPVLRIQSEYPMVGGAANVARNVSALGANAAIVGITGTEPAADEFGSLLAAIARLTSLVVKEPLRTTTVKTRYYGDQRQLLRADREVVVPLNAAASERLCQAITGGAAKSNAIIVSDYAKGVVDAATFAAAVAAARKARIPLLVDPKGADLARYRGASVLTPNAGELAAATGMPVRDDPTAEAAARRAMELSGVPAVVATRGAAGITVVEQGKAPVHLRARAREVRDVSGAGDTVVAMLAAALAGGATLAAAAELANAAAAVVVGKVGTAVASPDEVRMALYSRELLAADDKIVDLATALERVQRWRRNGETVAFTNGCFDLVHPGHVSLLAQARATAHRLVVGLNSDASVRRLKGEERPIQSEAARAVVLASLATVDLVVLFGEDTPLRLIESLRPDVLVKGADYTVDTVVGADHVHSWGGRVHLAQLVEGASSTKIVQRIGKLGGGRKSP